MKASSAHNKKPMTAHEVRQIAVASQTDPRTVRRVLDGRPTKDMVRGRVLEALRAAGFGATEVAMRGVGDSLVRS